MSRWIFKIAVLIAISGIIALFFVPKDYALIVCWIAGGALLVACGVMLLIGKRIRFDKADELIFDPIYADFSINVWHEKENKEQSDD